MPTATLLETREWSAASDDRILPQMLRKMILLLLTPPTPSSPAASFPSHPALFPTLCKSFLTTLTTAKPALPLLCHQPGQILWAAITTIPVHALPSTIVSWPWTSAGFWRKHCHTLGSLVLHHVQLPHHALHHGPIPSYSRPLTTSAATTTTTAAAFQQHLPPNYIPQSPVVQPHPYPHHIRSMHSAG